MTELVEKLHAGGFLLSRPNGNRAVDNAILVSGQNLLAGAVLGKTVTAGTITATEKSIAVSQLQAAGILVR